MATVEPTTPRSSHTSEPTGGILHGSGGVRLHVLRWEGGDLPLVPFLLVHGLASSAGLWTGVAQQLHALGHPVVAVNQRGHGRSDKPDSGYDFATVTADLAEVIGQLGWDRPVVVGQSWGGNVVLELAARYPDRVRGVACVDGGTIELATSFPSWDDCAVALAPPRLEGTPRSELEAHFRARHRDWPETGIQGALACFEVRGDGTVAPWLTFERHLLILRALWEHHPTRLYAGLQVPVLLVPADSGDEGRTASKRHAIELAAATIPRARTHWFAPADHDVHAQHPAEVAAVLHQATRDGFFA